MSCLSLQVFYAPSSRFCHMRRVHASSEQKFRCTLCSKVFTFHYELRNHMKMMHWSKTAGELPTAESETPKDEEDTNGTNQSLDKEEVKEEPFKDEFQKDGDNYNDYQKEGYENYKGDQYKRAYKEDFKNDKPEDTEESPKEELPKTPVSV